MLRIFLWKIGFEWTQLKRLLWPCMEKKIYYFAFGANLSADVLQRRRIKVYESFDYTLDGARLRFSQLGFYKGHGYASADAAEGEEMYGKMYLILETDAARMDYFEGVPILQVHDKIFRQENEYEYYYYRAITPREGLKPTQDYLDYIVTAYRRMPNVPPAYVESLAGTEVLNQFIPHDETGEFVRDIQRWPSSLHPALVYYEGCCQLLVEFLWNRSLFQWMIKS